MSRLLKLIFLLVLSCISFGLSAQEASDIFSYESKPDNIVVSADDFQVLGMHIEQKEAMLVITFSSTDEVLRLSKTNRYEIKFDADSNEIAYGLIARVYEGNKETFKVKRYFRIPCNVTQASSSLNR